jgi:ADP-ribose pyrophosphatase
MTDNSNPTTVWKGRHIDMAMRGHWEFAHRHTASAIAVLVPVTDAGKLILIEQYRPPVNKRVIELPAGLVGDEPGAENESTESEANRELLEETGYKAGQLRHLFRGTPSAGICSEEVDFYLATDLKKVGPGGGEASEDITVYEVPLAEVESWLEEKQKEPGIILDAKIFSGVYFAEKFWKNKQ